jgi:pyruvate,water dikinase
MVRNYLLAEADPGEHERRVAGRRAELLAQIEERLRQRPLERALGLRRRLVRYVLERTKYFVTLRENSRFYWIMAAHVTRRKILRLEARLIAEGRLRCRDDVFFLACDEVERLASGALGWTDVEERIAERRREFVRLAKLTPPRTIGIAAARPGVGETGGAVGRPEAGAAIGAEGAVLRGQTASPGRCEGAARVILDPTVDVELRPGEVLVAPYTDPAWTPLFLTAGAAVVEVGSFLSHAGTVAREYGLPCVVDVADCTTRIRTGDRLLVDGDTGVVRVLT